MDGLADGAVQDAEVLGAVRDGGRITTFRHYTGLEERGVSWHPVLVLEYAKNHDKLDRLRAQVESGTISLRVAATYPAEHAAEAHRRFEAGGVRGRPILTF